MDNYFQSPHNFKKYILHLESTYKLVKKIEQFRNAAALFRLVNKVRRMQSILMKYLISLSLMSFY